MFFNQIKILAIIIIIFCSTINANAFVNIDNSIPHSGIYFIDEVTFVDGEMITGRRLNGDESGQGQRLSLRDPSKIYHVKAYRYR